MSWPSHLTMTSKYLRASYNGVLTNTILVVKVIPVRKSNYIFFLIQKLINKIFKSITIFL